MRNSNWVGQTLGGRYKIEELLGQGGMSAVYKATDPNLERVVAIKLIHPHLANNPDFQRRFKEEATGVAMLRHPHIVQVYDFEQDGDVTYMVLEFVPGETLQSRLKRLNQQSRHMPLEDAVRFTTHVSEAMGYAHQRGMIHRDIKPANIMLDVQGQAILMDFGIAKIMGGTQHTATGATIGTAMYMAPEQIKSDRPDERADIYSLGVTLFEMVSGRPPFESESAMTVMMMHLNDPVPDLRQARQPHVPEGVVHIIEKALAKDRQDRFQSAAEMGSALRRAMTERYKPAAFEATALEGPGAAPPPTGQPEVGMGATFVDPALNQGRSNERTYVEQPPAGGSQSRTYVERPAAGAAGAGTFAVPPAGGAGPGSRPASGTGSYAAGGGAPPAGGPPAGGAGVFPAGQSGKRSDNRKLLFAGAAVLAIVLLCVLAGGGLALSQWLGRGARAGLNQPTSTGTSPAVSLLGESEGTALVIEEATDTPQAPTATPTLTLTPTRTPTPTMTPTATVPPGRYVRINEITTNAEGKYVVEYETFEYTEVLPGEHVHFFFNTVTPEAAGVPGKGPWILYGGPRPFTGYKVSDRPANATQMCALVANPNHSVIAESGNCLDLP